MKQQTAVEWLIEEINKRKAWANPQILEPLINQAKQIEIRQHENTWIDSRIEMKGDGYDYIGKEKSFEEYYKENYGTANSD
jgi:hypothetical protein